MNFNLGVFVPGTRDVVHTTSAWPADGTRLGLTLPGEFAGLATGFPCATEWRLDEWTQLDVDQVVELYRARGLRPPQLPAPRPVPG